MRVFPPNQVKSRAKPAPWENRSRSNLSFLTELHLLVLQQVARSCRAALRIPDMLCLPSPVILRLVLQEIRKKSAIKQKTSSCVCLAHGVFTSEV